MLRNSKLTTAEKALPLQTVRQCGVVAADLGRLNLNVKEIQSQQPQSKLCRYKRQGKAVL